MGQDWRLGRTCFQISQNFRTPSDDEKSVQNQLSSGNSESEKRSLENIFENVNKCAPAGVRNSELEPLEENVMETTSSTHMFTD